MQDLNGERGSAFSAARWTVAGRGGRQIVRFAVSLVLARLLLPAEFGLMGVALVVIGFLDLVGDLGTGQAVIQRRSLSPSLLSSVFALNVGIGCALAVVMWASADLVADAYSVPDQLSTLLRVLALGSVLTSSTVVQRALLARSLQFRRIAVADLYGGAANGVAAVGLAWGGFGVWALIAGHLASTAVSTLLLWAYADFRPTLKIRRAELREIAPFSLNLAAFNVSSYLLNNADALIISRVLGIEAMGYYMIAQRLVILPLRAVSQMLGGVLLPVLARHQEDAPRLQRDFLRSCAGIVLVAFPMVAGVAIVADLLVPVVLGAQWVTAVPMVVLLTPSGFLLAPRFSVGAIYRAVGRTDWLLRMGVVTGVLRALGCLLGALHSLEGVAIGLAVANLVTFYPTFAAPFRLIELPFSRLLGTLAPYAGLSAVMAVPALGIRLVLESLGAPPIVELGAAAGVGASTYFIGALWTRVPALEDLRRFATIGRASGAEESSEQALL